MLSEQPMLSGYGKVSHGNMQKLSENDFSVTNIFIETVAVRNVLHWQNIDHFADRIIPDVPLKVSNNPVAYLPLVPFFHVNSRQSSVGFQLFAFNLLLH
jgi:hypothetical protein